MSGFIYVFTNPSMQGLVKIGKSAKDPREYRLKELNTTGVPEPFICDYSALVQNEDNLEKALHDRFSTERKNKNREFFKVGVQEVISAIRDISQKTKNTLKLEEFSNEQKQKDYSVSEENRSSRSANDKKQNSKIKQKNEERTAKDLYQQAKKRDEKRLNELHDNAAGLAHDWNDRTIKS